MSGLNKLTRQDYKRHILFWAIIIVIINIIDPISTANVKKYIIVFFLIQSNNIFTFYLLGLFVLPKYLNRNYPVFILLFVFTYIIYASIDYLNFYHVYIKFEIESTISERPLKTFLFEDLLFYGIIALCSLSFYMHRLSIYKLKEQSKKEKEILIKELFLLKNHLNSNLTNNFLKYCHDGLMTYSEKAASSVKVYSEMMEYNRNTNSNEKVKLNSEVRYIKNFISLQKLLSLKVFVTFNHDDEYHNITIYPRILICFIENAFKHGVINNPDYPIRIDLNVNNNNILFLVKNKINFNKRYKSTKIGKENVIQILEMLYRDKYKIQTKQIKDEYKTELILNFNN